MDNFYENFAASVSAGLNSVEILIFAAADSRRRTANLSLPVLAHKFQPFIIGTALEVGEGIEEVFPAALTAAERHLAEDAVPLSRPAIT